MTSSRRRVSRHLLIPLWRHLPRSYCLRRNLMRLAVDRFLVGLGGVVLNPAGEVLLVHHTYRVAYPWGLPTGWLKRQEQPAAGIVREIHEETGYQVQVAAPLPPRNDPSWPRVDLLFLCQLSGGSFRPSAEVDQAAFFALDQLPPIRPSQIDIITAAANLAAVTTGEAV